MRPLTLTAGVSFVVRFIPTIGRLGLNASRARYDSINEPVRQEAGRQTGRVGVAASAGVPTDVIRIWSFGLGRGRELAEIRSHYRIL